jgi:hypothetical protein
VNISRHLELGGEYEANFLTFSDRAEAVGIHVARLRLRSALNVRMSATALLQYNSNADVVGVNVRARYNMREGTDLWLVYDEGLNTERTIDGIPEAIPLSQSRAVRIKFTYTFAL